MFSSGKGRDKKGLRPVFLGAHAVQGSCVFSDKMSQNVGNIEEKSGQVNAP
jgi:hypothetical protein